MNSLDHVCASLGLNLNKKIQKRNYKLHLSIEYLGKEKYKKELSK